MILKWRYISLGTPIILGGVITFWLPIPIGVPLMLIGTPIILRHSARGRRWILRFTQRHDTTQRAGSMAWEATGDGL